MVFNPKSEKSYLYLAKIFKKKENIEEEENKKKTAFLIGNTSKSNNKQFYLTPLREFNKIILFGAAHRGERVLVNLLQYGIKKNSILFCDNDSKNWGKVLLGVKVISIEELKKLSRDIKIIISSSTFYLKAKMVNLKISIKSKCKLSA